MIGGRGPLRMGVAGCADIAIRRMLPVMARSSDVELVAVASRDRAKAADAARPYGCRPVHGYQALMDSEVEAVYVPLPCALHAKWVRSALLAGKHVLAEKPLSSGSECTRELFALASERGLALMENVMFVHHPQHEAVRNEVLRGRIGALRSLRAEFTIPRRGDGDIRYQWALEGGALLDTGVYPVRAAVHLLGRDLAVDGAALVHGPGFEVDTAGVGLLRSPDGVLAHLVFGLDHGYRSVCELTGTNGRITLAHAFTPPAEHEPVLRVETGAGTEEIRLPAHDQVAATLAAFATAACAGTSPGRADGIASAGLLERIRRHANAPG